MSLAMAKKDLQLFMVVAPSAPSPTAATKLYHSSLRRLSTLSTRLRTRRRQRTEEYSLSGISSTPHTTEASVHADVAPPPPVAVQVSVMIAMPSARKGLSGDAASDSASERSVEDLPNYELGVAYVDMSAGVLRHGDGL